MTEAGEGGKLIGLTEIEPVLRAAMRQGVPTLCIGETATAKTSLVKALATELGRELVRVNLDGGSTPDELVGRYQLKGTETVFEHGIIPYAMKRGAILLLDELNAALPDTLFVIHALLENPPRLLIPETGEDLHPAEGFCVVATCNPSHEYAGTKAINPALYSRFGVVLRFDPLKGGSLLKALKGHEPEATAEALQTVAATIDTANRLRKDEKIVTRLTIREGIAALHLMAHEQLSLEQVMTHCLLGRLEPEERTLLKASVTRELSK